METEKWATSTYSRRNCDQLSTRTSKRPGPGSRRALVRAFFWGFSLQDFSSFYGGGLASACVGFKGAAAPRGCASREEGGKRGSAEGKKAEMYGGGGVPAFGPAAHLRARAVGEGSGSFHPSRMKLCKSAGQIPLPPSTQPCSV